MARTRAAGIIASPNTLRHPTAAAMRGAKRASSTHGRLRLGVSLTACQYLLPTILREFRESFPHCVIQIEPSDTPAAVELLRQHRIDLAIVAEPRSERLFELQPLFTDELHFIVSPLHLWAKAGRVERGEIVRQHFILYSKASYMYEMIHDYFHAEGRERPAALHLGSMEAIRNW